MKVSSLPYEPGGQVPLSKEGMDPIQGGSWQNAIPEAMSSVAEAFGNVGNFMQQKQEETENFKAGLDWQTTENTVYNDYHDMKVNADPAEAHFTEKVNSNTRSRTETFIQGLPKRLQPQYRVAAAQLEGDYNKQSLLFDYDNKRQYAQTGIDRQITEAGSRVFGNPDSADAELERYKKLVNDSPLTPVEKEIKIAEGEKEIRNSEYRKRYLGDQQNNLDINRTSNQILEFVKPGSRASTANRLQWTNPAFGNRLLKLMNDAYAATGVKPQLNDLFRSYEEQSGAYKRSGGGKFFPAAKPGNSRHQRGAAADFNRNGAWKWMYKNASNYGLEFLSFDTVHVQLARGVDEAPFTTPGGPGGAMVPSRAGPGTGKAPAGSDPGANFSFDQFKYAIYGAETGFGTNVRESSAGALGPMQIIPLTAIYVASKLKDPRAPAIVGDPGSDRNLGAMRSFLLNNPEIAREYGEFYLNEMLVQFGNDWQAAAIAYNAGPDDAQRWLDSGRNDAVLEPETRDYLGKVMTYMGSSVRQGEGSPQTNLDSNPKYDIVPWQQKYAAQEDAAQEARRRQKDIEAQETRQIADRDNQIKLGIDHGQVGYSEIEQLERSGVVTDADQLAGYRNRIGARDKEVNKVVDANADYNNPNKAWTNTDEDNDTVDLLTAGPDGRAMEVLRSANAPAIKEYVDGVVQPVMEKTRLMPRQVTKALLNMTTSRNPLEVTIGFQTLMRMQDINQVAFASFVTEDDRLRVQQYRDRHGVTPDDELARDLSGARSIEDQQREERFRKEADTVIKDAKLWNTERDLLPKFQTWYSTQILPGTKVYLPPIGLARDALERERQNTFKHFYAKYHGQTDQAMAATDEHLKTLWGMTDVGGFWQLMKHPPDLAQYPKIVDSHDYMTEQGIEALREWSARVGVELPEGISFGLVSDEITKSDLQVRQIGRASGNVTGPMTGRSLEGAGLPEKPPYPSYQISGWDPETGQVFTPTGANGKPLRIRFAPTWADLRLNDYAYQRDQVSERFAAFLEKSYRPMIEGQAAELVDPSIPADVKEQYRAYIQEQHDSFVTELDTLDRAIAKLPPRQAAAGQKTGRRVRTVPTAPRPAAAPSPQAEPTTKSRAPEPVVKQPERPYATGKAKETVIDIKPGGGADEPLFPDFMKKLQKRREDERKRKASKWPSFGGQR